MNRLIPLHSEKDIQRACCCDLQSYNIGKEPRVHSGKSNEMEGRNPKFQILLQSFGPLARYLISGARPVYMHYKSINQK